MRLNLYEMNTVMEWLLCNVVNEDGEIDEESDAFQAYEGMVEDRAERFEYLGMLVKEIEASKQALLNEADNLKARAEKKDREIARIKSYMLDNMDEKEKIETTKVVIKASASETTEIDSDVITADKLKEWMQNEETAAFVNHKVTETWTPSKNDIKKALKKGIAIDGAKIVVNRKVSVE